MIGSTAKICTAGEKLSFEACQESAKMPDFQRICVLWVLSGRCMGRIDGEKR